MFECLNVVVVVPLDYSAGAGADAVSTSEGAGFRPFILSVSVSQRASVKSGLTGVVCSD